MNEQTYRSKLAAMLAENNQLRRQLSNARANLWATAGDLRRKGQHLSLLMTFTVVQSACFLGYTLINL